MRILFSRWLLPVVLAVGISAPVLAGGDKDGHHHHGGGCGPASGISKCFGDFFMSTRKIDMGIDESFTFTVDTQSSFSAMILSSGIGDFVGSLMGWKGNTFSETFNIDEGKTTFSALIGPGKYSLVLQGTIDRAPAGYVGGFSAVPVPEPAEWMMIMAGVAMMGFVVSRRRNIG